ncbi:hypothetical protein CerSpe_070580 [Prunus speciosa]
MALIVTKEILMHNCFIKRCPLCFCVASAIRRTALISNYDRESVLSIRYEKPVVSSVRYEQHQISSTRNFCASVQPERLCWEGSSHAVVLKRLEKALKEHQVNEAWESFIDFKRLHGFPEDFVIQRSDFLQSDILANLSLSVARSQMPKPATMILRILLDKQNFPAMNILCLVVHSKD